MTVTPLEIANARLHLTVMLASTIMAWKVTAEIVDRYVAHRLNLPQTRYFIIGAVTSSAYLMAVVFPCSTFLTLCVASVVLALIETSIQTCGEFGALLPSGIRVTFERNCKVRQREGRDREARLLRVETVGGEVIFDREKGIRVDDSRKFTVATLDFLASGGSAFKSFIGQKIIRDFGVFREILTEELERHPLSSDRPARVDQRWKEITPVSAGERR